MSEVEQKHEDKPTVRGPIDLIPNPSQPPKDLLAQIVNASCNSGISPSEVPELVAAYMAHAETQGRVLGADQAKREIRNCEILFFGLDGKQDLRSDAQLRWLRSLMESSHD